MKVNNKTTLTKSLRTLKESEGALQAAASKEGSDNKDITCDMRGRCYRKSQKVTAVFTH